MFKKILHFSYGTDASPKESRDSNAAAPAKFTHTQAAGEIGSERISFPTPSLNAVRTRSLDALRTFDEIYKTAPAQPPRMVYGILKVAEMLNSPHLAGMSHETKRCSVMMAIETAGIPVEDLLQDAMLRQRALNDYENGEDQRLKEFESTIDKENGQLQTELERLTAQYMARIQRNIDEVAASQDRFRAWQKRKNQEMQHISSAAAICVPKSAEANGNNASYSAVLARVGAEQTAGAR
jgi:hypothetical protein